MKTLIKTIIIAWLAMSAVFIWIAGMVVGFMSCFIHDMSWFYSVTPFIGLACVLCIASTIRQVYKYEKL